MHWSDFQIKACILLHVEGKSSRTVFPESVIPPDMSDKVNCNIKCILIICLTRVRQTLANFVKTVFITSIVAVVRTVLVSPGSNGSVWQEWIPSELLPVPSTRG